MWPPSAIPNWLSMINKALNDGLNSDIICIVINLPTPNIRLCCKKKEKSIFTSNSYPKGHITKQSWIKSASKSVEKLFNISYALSEPI